MTFVGICFAFVNICKKKKKEEEEDEEEEERERMKNGVFFLCKSHTCACIRKKWNTRLQFFGLMRFSGWTCKSNCYFSIFFILVQ